MANFNKVILVGNLTRDPQMSYLPSQTPVVEFGLAVNRRWRSQNGEQREDTCFIDCRCYGKAAETLNQYMSKGSPILVEGRLDLDTWESKEGQRRSKHRVTVENFQFLGSAGGGQRGGGRRQGGGYQDGPPRQASGGQQPYPSEPPAPDFGDQGGEDIPF
jgi:single-strand DNA-binding protein